MKGEKTYSSIWEYLDATGVLENGTEEEIQAAKKEYWRIYQRNYKRRMRREQRQVVVWLSKIEQSELEAVSGNQKPSLPTLIRERALAYTRQRFLVPDPLLVGRIEQHLSLIRQSIRELAERDTDNWFSDTKRYRRIEQMLKRLETELIRQLRHPELIKDFIKHAKTQNPELLVELREMLDYDH